MAGFYSLQRHCHFSSLGENEWSQWNSVSPKVGLRIFVFVYMFVCKTELKNKGSSLILLSQL